MALGGRPSKTAEERALERAQARELDRQYQEINERKRRILRSQIGGRSSLLSGSERGVREGEVRQTRGGTSTPTLPGRSGTPRSAGRGILGSGGGGRRGAGGRRVSIL